MNMKKILYIMLAGLLFAGCAQMQNEDINNQDSDVRIIELDAFDFAYSQEEIRVEQGERIRIVIRNTQGTHDFNIDEFNVHSEIIPEGTAISVEFLADRRGEFAYYCSIGNHRAMGMEGMLIVE
jgi:plastocyanin